MTPDTQRRARRRLSIMRGQLEALQRYIDEDRYCMDVLDLSMSIQRALRSLDGIVIEGHLRTHVVEQMRGDEIDRAVRELLRLYRVQGPGDGAATTTPPAGHGESHHG